MKKDIKELLLKRAKGFYYNEEVAEYDVVGRCKFFLCKKHRRLYFGAGYLVVKIAKIYVGNKIVRLGKPAVMLCRPYLDKKALKTFAKKRRFTLKKAKQ